MIWFQLLIAQQYWCPGICLYQYFDWNLHHGFNAYEIFPNNFSIKPFIQLGMMRWLNIRLSLILTQPSTLSLEDWKILIYEHIVNNMLDENFQTVFHNIVGFREITSLNQNIFSGKYVDAELFLYQHKSRLYIFS